MYGKKIIDQLLQETDKRLSVNASIVLIGGAVLIAKYLSPRGTMDVDTYAKFSSEVAEAWSQAEKSLGVAVPLSRAIVSEGPYNMEDRFERYDDLQLTKLTVLIPSAIDLIMMKITRLFGKDLDDILFIIKGQKIAESDLLKIFKNEMGHITGSADEIRSKYLLAIAAAFGEKVADKHAAALS